MSERENNSILVRAASGSVRRVVRHMLRRWILALAALTALVFVPPAPSQARSQSAASKSATAAPAKPIAGASPTKGQREGINVHGWWTIEVRNPDGNVVSHTEFENTLVQPSGAATLTSILTGTLVPGGYAIILADSLDGGGGPCEPSNVGSQSCLLFGSLTSPTPTTFTYVDNCPGQPGQCFPLSITPGSTGFTVGGTATSFFASQHITDVYLDVLTCPSSAPPAPSSINAVSPSACAAGLAGLVSLTHATLATPVLVPAAGQSIAVTVQLSFQ